MNRIVHIRFSMLALFLTAQLAWILTCHAIDSIQQRHSFSLTTFDPMGKLSQLEFAQQAAAMGIPLVVVQQADQLILAAPQVLPSILDKDDGTPRFLRLTDHIIVGHSGLSADGRVLMTAMQRIALEHEYTFQEEISVERLLEETSLIFQEYTMKPASRPFGSTLIVGHLTSTGLGGIYRIDPTGNVESVEPTAIINGNLDRTTNISSGLESLGLNTNVTPQDVADLLGRALADLVPEAQRNTNRRICILTAKLDRDGFYRTDRHCFDYGKEEVS